MANVLNRVTREFIASVNTPDFPETDWIINPDLTAVAGFDPAYWVVAGNNVTLANAANRLIVDDNAFTALINAQSTTSELFGDGSDGPVTIAVDTPLTGDLYPTILVVNAGATLSVKGFNILGQFGIINNGTIEFDGSRAALNTAGVGAATGTRGGGGTGALGSSILGSAAASLLSIISPGFGGSGGNGGAGGGGAGGLGGATRLGTSTRLRPRRMLSCLVGGEFDAANGFVQFQGGAGGGAGGGDLLNPGGSGGGGAGFFCLAAPFIYNGPTGIISAKGGNGFTPTVGNCGGGGGGGGGDLTLVRLASRSRGVLNMNGGNGGNGIGTGVAGQPGVNGNVRIFTVTRSSQ